jgi:hypothetical protein
MVELRTASNPEGKFTVDPGTGSAHLEAGPSFTEEAFVKQSGLFIPNVDWDYPAHPVIGGASSKLVARADGVYRLGVHVEIPKDAVIPWASFRCLVKLSLNGESLIDTWVYGKPGEEVSAILDKNLQLSVGLYDTTFLFGCFCERDKKIAQRTMGKATILIAHPGELAPAPAVHDFVSPVAIVHQAPTPAEPSSAPVIPPAGPLPPGFGRSHS